MEFSQVESALLETIAKATSQDVQVIKSAEIKLKEWEIEPGYYSSLLKIILNHSIDATVRLLAASIFKNGIDKYWRKAADNAIQEQEKASLRSDVMNTFGEPVNAVAIQIAVLISRIARYDCPREWPELIPNLLQIIKSDNLLVQYRGLLTLNQVVKALASKRLPGDRGLFQLITADMYSFVLNLWNVLFQEFFLQVQNNDPTCQGTLAKVLLALKILRKLTIHGFKQPHESQDVLTFINLVFERMKEMFLFHLENSFQTVTVITVTKIIMALYQMIIHQSLIGRCDELLNIYHIYRLFDKISSTRDEKFNQSLPRCLASVTSHLFPDPYWQVCSLLLTSYIFLDCLTFCQKSDASQVWKYGGKFNQLTDLSEDVISRMVKVLHSLLENHPYSFISFIQPSLSFIVVYIFTEADEHVLFKKFIYQCLNLMEAIILCPEYRMMRYKGAENNSKRDQAAAEVSRIKREFFQTEILTEICTKLITHYFLLTREDLQLWDEDPENFAFDEIGESSTFCIHPCAHSLYLALLHQFRSVFIPVVMKLVRNNQQIVDPQDLNGILRKDAVYCSLGLCAFEFYDEVDFSQWFNTTLIHELAIKESNYRIIRRRVVWLIGKWTFINPAVEMRLAIYGVVIPLLHRSEDMVVRLTAAVTLKTVVDSLECTPDQFMNFLEPSFSLLFSLLQEVKECSTKMQILFVLSFFVEMIGEDIKPHSQSLIQYLPLLWEENANHNLLRCAIVSTLVQFVKALGSENLTSFLYPVIECCTDVTNDAHIYLIEDGLELWFTVVEYSSVLTPELFSLYKNMPVILEYTLEHLDCCCNIIQAYILLNPEKFLTECGESLITLCSSLLTDVNDRGLIKIMQVVETAIKASPEIGVKISLPMLVYTTLSICEGESWSMAVSMYFAIICRVLLYSRDIFSEVLGKAASVKSWRVETLLEHILLVWNKMMPFVTQLDKKKLLALALSSLLTVQSTVVLSQFSAIVKNIVEALNDIMDIDNLSAEMNSLMLVEDSSLLSDEVANEDSKMEKQKKQLNEADPVYKIELKGYLQSQLNDLKHQVGSTNFEGLLQTLDAEILQQCRIYIAL